MVSFNRDTQMVFVLVNPRGMEREVVRNLGSPISFGKYHGAKITEDLLKEFEIVDVTEGSWTTAKLLL